MPRSDEHAPLLETARVSSRGSRLDNRLALWGDSSNVTRAWFVTLAVLGLVALVVVRIDICYNLRSSRTLLMLPARPRPGDSPSVPPSKSHRSQGRTSHVNLVNNLNLRRESLATAAERSNAYRNARCSVAWLVHTGAHSGSLELEETVRDLQRITGVAANKEWRSDGNVEVKYGVPQFLQVPSLPKDFDFTESSGDGSFRARLSRTIREPLLRAIDAGHRGAFTVSHGTDAPGLLTMEKFVSALKADLNERQCDLVVLTSVRGTFFNSRACTGK